LGLEIDMIKPGDLVIAVLTTSAGGHTINAGQKYTIDSIHTIWDYIVCLKGVDAWFHMENFRVIKKTLPKTELEWLDRVKENFNV